MKHLLLCSMAMLLGLVSGCSTASLKDTRTLKIRSGLSPQEAKFALVSALLPERKPVIWPAERELTDEALRALYAEKFQSRDGPHWSLEELRSDAVVVKHQRGRHSLVVEYAVGEVLLSPRILRSENLNQTEKSIHENVFDWLESFGDIVDDNMEHLQDRKKAAAKAKT